MNKIISAAKPYLYEITHDFMIVVCIVSPIIMGLSFRFLIPFLESMLCRYFTISEVIAPYYIIFDLLLAIMAPLMFCFSGVLVMLEEFDSGTAKYYFVTPVGKTGYLFSRLGIAVFTAVFYTMLLLAIFTVSKIGFIMNIVFTISGGLMAIISSLLVTSYAKNKMEGMALIKLCGLLLIGIPVTYFLNSPLQYVFGVLPSFWLAKVSITRNYLYFIPTLVTSLALILILYLRFEKKLANQGYI